VTLTFDLRLRGLLQSCRECKIKSRAVSPTFLSLLVKAAEANFEIFEKSRLKLGKNFEKFFGHGLFE